MPDDRNPTSINQMPAARRPIGAKRRLAHENG
jgi:hypothetical protein